MQPFILISAFIVSVAMAASPNSAGGIMLEKRDGPCKESCNEDYHNCVSSASKCEENVSNSL